MQNVFVQCNNVYRVVLNRWFNNLLTVKLLGCNIESLRLPDLCSRYPPGGSARDPQCFTQENKRH